jgi:hypothetical protein
MAGARVLLAMEAANSSPQEAVAASPGWSAQDATRAQPSVQVELAVEQEQQAVVETWED